MKVTKEYLKQLIREQIKEQEDVAGAAAAAFDKAVGKAVGKKKVDTNLDRPKTSKDAMSAENFKNRLLKMAKDVSGIMKNEMDIIDFALAIIDAAKEKNLNSTILRQRLEMAKKEMEKIKS